MKIFISHLLSATAFIVVTITALCMLLFTTSSSSFSSALTPDDMKCQVCDIAAAHYGRTLLHAQLFCLNKAYVNATDGETQTKLAYLVRVLEPFKLPGIDKDFCTEDSPAKRNPGKNEGVPATALKKTNKDEAAAENEAKREADEIDEVLSEEDSDNNENKPVAGGDNVNAADDKGLVVDSVTANEIGRKNWICRAFLDSFPAIEMFPAQEGKSFDPDDPKTYEGEDPQKVPQKFIEILKRACEISVASPRTNGKMIAAARKAVANFPTEDAPRTINGARNHIFKNVLRDVQNAACASNCPADVQRPKNFKAVAAFTVDNRPIIQ